jgi:hypothetical protein
MKCWESKIKKIYMKKQKNERGVKVEQDEK